MIMGTGSFFSIKVPDEILSVSESLRKEGYESYLVGGCVRDALLGKIPFDFDITTNALPDQIISVFKDRHCILTGVKHGTVTVVENRTPVEITTYRIDGGYSDGRHPDSVSFTDDLELDLNRRDFTINAMAYDTVTGLRDPLRGRDDLEKHIIRCVGDPDSRFGEDALRILRALRFSSVLDFTIDGSTADSIHKLYGTLARVSVERIFTELKKALCGTGISRILRDYPNVIAQCVPGTTCDGITGSAEGIGSLVPDPMVRLSYILLCCGCADTTGTMRSLKSSVDESRAVSSMCQTAVSPYPSDDLAVKRMMGKYTDDIIRNGAALRSLVTADSEGFSSFISKYEEILSQDPCVRISSLDISGDDIIRITGYKGKKIGEVLSLLLELVMQGRVPNDHASLEDAMRTIITDHTS